MNLFKHSFVHLFHEQVNIYFVPGNLPDSVSSARNDLLTPALQELKAESEHSYAHKTQGRKGHSREFNGKEHTDLETDDLISKDEEMKCWLYKKNEWLKNGVK